MAPDWLNLLCLYVTVSMPDVSAHRHALKTGLLPKVIFGQQSPARRCDKGCQRLNESLYFKLEPILNSVNSEHLSQGKIMQHEQSQK